MASPKRHKSKVDHKDTDHSSDDDLSRRKNHPRGYRPPIERQDSLVKARIDHEDSDWDTDYNPKDKYYLSSDDDPLDLYPPESKSPPTRQRSRQGSWERKSPLKDRDTDRGSSSRKEPSHSRSHAHARHHSPSRPHSRSRERDDKASQPRPRDHKDSPSRPRGDKDGSPRKHKSTTATFTRSKPPSDSHASHSRPKPSRGSSSHHNSSRPRPTRSGSSYTHSASRSSRPRPVRGLSHNSSQTKAKPKIPKDLARLVGPEGIGELSKLLEEFPWQEAGRVAMQAGTVAGKCSVPLCNSDPL